MKKIGVFLILMVALFSCNKSQAQVLMYSNTDSTSAGTATTVTTRTSDTVWDANTNYTLYTKAGALKGLVGSKYLITFDVTKITGTGTAKVFVQGSDDGVTWRNMNTGMPGTDGYCSDTLNIAAASTTTLKYAYYSSDGKPVIRYAATYYVNNGRVFYIRLKIVCAGTQSTIYSNGQVYTFQ